MQYVVTNHSGCGVLVSTKYHVKYEINIAASAVKHCCRFYLCTVVEAAWISVYRIDSAQHVESKETCFSCLSLLYYFVASKFVIKLVKMFTSYMNE